MANEKNGAQKLLKEAWSRIRGPQVSRGNKHEGSLPPVKTAFLSVYPRGFLKNHLRSLLKGFPSIRLMKIGCLTKKRYE